MSIQASPTQGATMIAIVLIKKRLTRTCNACNQETYWRHGLCDNERCAATLGGTFKHRSIRCLGHLVLEMLQLVPCHTSFAASLYTLSIVGIDMCSALSHAANCRRHPDVTPPRACCALCFVFVHMCVYVFSACVA